MKRSNCSLNAGKMAWSRHIWLNFSHSFTNPRRWTLVLLVSFFVSVDVYATENLIMDIPSGSREVDSFTIDGVDFYIHKISSKGAVNDEGTVIQQVYPSTPSETSKEYLTTRLLVDRMPCEGAWSKMKVQQKSRSRILLDRNCLLKDEKKVSKYQESLLLLGNERAFIVSILWTMPDRKPVNADAEVLAALKDETKKYFETAQICGGKYESCKDARSERLQQKINNFFNKKNQ